MKIPESAIRPFEPHGLPKTYMGEMAVQFLVTAITKSILATHLNGLVLSQVNSLKLRRVQVSIENQLTDGGLENVYVELWLKNNDELHCAVNYILGGKRSGMKEGWWLTDEHS